MKWSSLAVPIMLVIYILVILNYSKYQQEEFDVLKQREYDIMVNYATDAAMQEGMRQVADDGVDYRNLYAIKIDPEFALDIFCECMLRNLNWSVTDENVRMFKDDFLVYFAVTEGNGFYMYRDVPDEEQVVLFDGTVVGNYVEVGKWSPKIPYCIKKADRVNIYELQSENYSYYDIATKNIYDEEPHTQETIDERNSVVASTITTAMNQAISSKFDGKLDVLINLPAVSNDYVKAPSKPAVYAMVVDTVTLTNKYIVAVAGTQVSISESYIGYTLPGNDFKYYTLSDNRDAVMAKGGSITEVFSSAIAAAKEGYYPDVYFK